MRPAVWRRLNALRETAGQAYGKLVQKLLALAFLEAGVGSLVERSTQGIDLEFQLGGDRFAIEVKTTEAGSIRFGKKDIVALEARVGDGVRAYVAVLGGRLLDDWILAQFGPRELASARTYSTTELRPYRDARLEDLITEPFAHAVLAHAAAAAAGQPALDALLAEYPEYQRA